MSEGVYAADLLAGLTRGITAGASDQAVFSLLGDAMAALVGFKVYTILRIDPGTLRSVRLHSSEPSYAIGGTKQHVVSAWSEAVFGARTFFMAPDIVAVRATFPDSAAIEATGCGSVLAVPIVADGERVIGTMNLWHVDGFYNRRKGEIALPFAAAVASVCAG